MFLEEYLAPQDFSHCMDLEIKLYKKNIIKYAYAKTNTNQVRMLLFKNEEGDLKMIYPMLEKRPILVKDEENDENISLLLANSSVSEFIDKLHEEDVIVTHLNVFLAKHCCDEEIQLRILYSLQ